MATKTAAKKTAAKKAAPAPEPEVDELEELEELEEGETAAEGTKSAAQEVTFGASDLAKHLSELSGKTVSPRELRTLIRKMARDGQGRVNREVQAGNRTRYNWTGVDDPEVQAIIAAFNGGELEADKQAKLKELKENKAKKKAAAEAEGKTKGKKAGKGKKADPEPVAEEADDDDELELDDEE